jgi:prepilin-type N-terminal cleavage/methylation domain-containing protein
MAHPFLKYKKRVSRCPLGRGTTAVRRLGSGGFTLLELIIVISILAILASVAIPKYADVLLKAQEGSLKGNLGTMRSALSLYYSDNMGTNPSCVLGPNSSVLANVLIPKYIPNIPTVNNGLHPPTNSVYCDAMMVPGDIHDGQGWYYDGVLPTDSQAGGIWIACDHTDTNGSAWTSY